MSDLALTVNEALSKIENGESVAGYDVQVTDELDAVKAFHLRNNGIEVPDDLITYEDDDLAYDADFDEDNWTLVSGSVNEETAVIVALDLEQDVKNWVAEKDVKLDTLLKQLLRNFYESHQLAEGVIQPNPTPADT